MNDINARGLVMVGCGFMGQAMFEGWLRRDLNRDVRAFHQSVTDNKNKSGDESVPLHGNPHLIVGNILRTFPKNRW